MELTGKNGEYADFILSKMKVNQGWINMDDILEYLHEKYNYEVEPEYVLRDLIDDWKFIINDGNILRLTMEGDKAAKSGVADYLGKRGTTEKRNNVKEWMSIGKIVFDIILAAAGFILGRCTAGL